MKKRILLICVALPLMVYACAVSLTEIEQERAKGARGAAPGQAPGSSSDSASGIAGARIAEYIDKHEQDLGKVLPQSEETYVLRDENNLLITFKSDILFNVDSAVIKADASGVLHHVIEVVNKYTATNLVISGHTDSSGSEKHNMKLSEQRALAVKKALEAGKVAPQRISAIGYGESKPIATNATELGKQSNRRVTIQIIPIKAGESVNR